MIHPLANIDKRARIGNNVTIEAFVTIQGDVEIGDNSWIGPNAVIFNGARIGCNCRVFPGAVISTIPQDLKFSGEYSTVEIGNNTTIREFATVNRGTMASGKTVVGDNTLLMAYAHVAHDCVVGNNVIMANACTLGGHVIVDDHAILGGLCAIHQFCHIGRHVIIAGGSLVGKDVPPYTKSGRFPLSYLGVNSVGLRRRLFTEEKIQEIQAIYRVLFVSNRNVSEALKHIEAYFPATPERDEILSFCRNSGRGVMKGYSSSSNG